MDGPSLSFSLVSGTGDTDNGLFTISGTTLSINTSPDFETQSVYSIRVRVSDGTFLFDKVLFIIVTNVNELPISVNDAYVTDRNVTLNISAAS